MWENIHVNDYGWTAKLRIVQDAIPQDVSEYTTLQMVFKPPVGDATVKTATLEGTDTLVYVVETGLINQVGYWQVQPRISATGAVITGDALTFRVEDRLD